jgi:hypothetical protein
MNKSTFLSILTLIWPQVRRRLIQRGAEYAANYLQTRRERRLEKQTALPDDSPAIPAKTPDSFLTSNTLWYTLSGIMLGAAMGVIFWLLRRED